MTDWVNKATTDPDIIRGWFHQWPHANLSIVTGEGSGIFVLDIDVKSKPGEDNGYASIEKLTEKHGTLPMTPTFFTGSGGVHLLFKYPGRHVPTKAKIAPGIDVRGDGGQIVAPPSRNAIGLYEVDPEADIDTEVADAPGWLLSLLSAAALDATDERERERVDLTEMMKGVPEGSRDQSIFRMACKLRDMDLPKDLAIEWCVRAAQNCSPPFPEKLAEEKVIRAYSRYAPRAIWDAKIFDKREDARVLAPREGREWIKPFPLVNPVTEKLPKDVFPDWMSEYIAAVAESIQVPEEMVATIALSAVAACVAKKGIIRVRRDWSEPLNIYTVVAVPPSGRKSPTFKKINHPIGQYEREQKEANMEDYTQKLFLKKGLEARLGKLQKDFQKDGANTQTISEEASKVQRQLLDLEHIDLPRLVVDDITPEKLATLLFRNHERIAVMSADGAGVFQQMCGRYTGIPDVDMYIKGWSGDEKVVDRQTRATEYLYNPAITLSLAVQPKILRGAARMSAADQGLFARILYCFPEDNIGKRRTDSISIPFNVSDTYHRNMRKLLELPFPIERIDVNGVKTTEMNVLCFNDCDEMDALHLMMEFETWLEVQRGEQVDDNMKEWLGKIGGNTARIIGLLHLAENISVLDGPDLKDVWKMPVRTSTVQAGTELGFYLISHACAAFDEMESDPIKNDAITIFTWIRKRKVSTFHKSEAIHKLGRAGEKVNAALTFLSERGYIRPVDRSADVRRGGDIPFEVNPFIHSNEYRACEEDTEEG